MIKGSDVAKSVLAEMNQEGEADFGSQVRQKISEIAACTRTIAAQQERLKTLQADLKEMQHVPIDEEILG